MAVEGLECLPTELYLKILFSVTDIASLASLLRASPRAYHVFDGYAVGITESVLSSGYTCGHIRVIFRIIALIRSATLPIISLEELRDRVLDESMKYKYRIRASRHGLAPEQLDNATSPAVLKSILATTRHVHALAHECLFMALARFNAVEVEQLVDECQPVCARDQLSSWISSKPATKKVQPQHSGPPTWEEEQRATRACWRLQLIYDLKRTGEKGTLGWSEADLLELSQKAAIVPPTENTRPSDRYRGSAANGLYNPHQQFWLGDRDHPHPHEFEEILTVVEHIGSRHGNDIAEKVANGNLSSRGLNGHDDIRRQWPLPGPCRGTEWRPIGRHLLVYQCSTGQTLFIAKIIMAVGSESSGLSLMGGLVVHSGAQKDFSSMGFIGLKGEKT